MNANTELYLAPAPKRLNRRQGTFTVQGKQYIQLLAEDPQLLISAAEKSGLGLEITASPKAPKDKVALTIQQDESIDIPAEGYKLTIRPEQIEITASTPAGAYYGACTLAQIRRQTGDEIPCLAISDWPDFPDRGVMLDISRDKVPTMETLFRFVDLLSDWKINQFQLYTEHTFAYLAHPKVWEHASPMTGEQIMELDAYCRNHFVELVPNQNSFGHMERWLKFDEYRPMAESPNGGDTMWGHFDYPFSLCPTDKRSIPFLSGLYDELLPHFTSSLFNVGLDETADLGYGRSKKICKERGTGKVYLDFLLQIYSQVSRHNRTMQFWGDIIMHYPELISELPEDAIALEWGYEADHPFAEHGAKFAESGIPFYVCPGTSAWNTLAGRTDNAIGNISNAAKNGLANGSMGMLNTSWGDMGHWDPLPVAYLGFMAGAVASWNTKADLKKTLAQNLSIHVFNDPTMKTGQAFYDLGNVYKAFKKRTFNCSVPWQVLFGKADDAAVTEKLKVSEFDDMERRLDEISSSLSGEQMACSDADTVRKELAFVFDILHISAKAGRARLSGENLSSLKPDADRIRDEHRSTWLLRNCPGGLEDSVSKLRVG